MTGERGPANDWTTILASEAAALAVDREMAEAWHRAALASEAFRDAWRREAGPPGPDAPARPPAAGPAPGPGELDALRRQVAELERRVAELARERSA